MLHVMRDSALSLLNNEKRLCVQSHKEQWRRAQGNHNSLYKPGRLKNMVLHFPLSLDPACSPSFFSFHVHSHLGAGASSRFHAWLLSFPSTRNAL
jgi:hypothetical protein